MKILLTLLTIAALGLTGCATQNANNASSLLAKVAEYNIDASKVSQTTTGPFYNHTESLAGLTHSDGHFSITDLNAQFNIPFPVLGIPLLHWELEAANITATKRSDLAPLTK